MTDEEIRNRYERTEETAGDLGENTIAISRFINMLHTHEKNVIEIIIEKIKKLLRIKNKE